MSWYEPNQVSEKLLAQADEMVNKIVAECVTKAEAVLLKHRKQLDKVAKELLVKETLESEEFEALMKP